MSNYLFVYGTLKRGFKMNKLLKNRAKFISKAYCYGKLYKLSYYPAAKLSKNKKFKIYGELYKIKKSYLKELLDTLDEYEEASKKFKKQEYKRVKTKVYYKNRVLKAWFYEYNLALKGLKRVNSGIFRA